MPSYAFRHQPLKGLYLVYQLISTLIIRFPLWMLISIPRSWRPRKTWSFWRTFQLRLLRHQFGIVDKTGRFISMPTHVALEKDAGGVWVEPPAPELITGQLAAWASTVDVKPIRLPGYWKDKKGLKTPLGQAPAPGEKVLYCLHGGGYTELSAHPSDITAGIHYGLLEHIKSTKRAFSIEYRLSVGPPAKSQYAFPTALIDALTGYDYLVNTVGFAPSNILIEGDSAGGNLALALTRYLFEYGDSPDVKLPGPPGGLILVSPWSDLSTSHNTPGSSRFANVHSDYIGDAIEYPTNAFLGPHGPESAKSNPYISPASLTTEISFTGFPRTFLNSGGAEVLLDQIKTLRDRMKRDMGDNLTYCETPDGIHVPIVLSWQDPERTETWRAIGDWVEAE